MISSINLTNALAKNVTRTVGLKPIVNSVSRLARVNTSLINTNRLYASVSVNPINIKNNNKKVQGKVFKNQTKAPTKFDKEPPRIPATFTLKTGQSFKGTSFGAPITESVSGEVVFTTSLVGYPESMTDPSYKGQILVFTQPLIGNYGIPAEEKDEFGLFKHFESDNIHVKAIIVCDYAKKYSHWRAVESLGEWCARHNIPAIEGVDTRAVVTILREQGSTLGEILIGDAKPAKELEDPNKRNLVAEVSVKQKQIYNKGAEFKIALIDCGAKQNIIRCLCKRGAEVHLVPWDHDFSKDTTKYNGYFISNGPGNPDYCDKTIENLKYLLVRESAKAVPTPIFGICMGNLLLASAAGFETYKLPYGNRGHNQPAINLKTNQCVITSQNHGFAIRDSDDKMVPGWERYFVNANDGSNEGIRHKTLPFASVQYHPEAKAGPHDTEYLFDEYMDTVREYNNLKQQHESTQAEKKISVQNPIKANINISVSSSS